MRFSYCPACGEKLTDRAIGDEGMVPYCARCEKPLFDMFPCCVIALVVNEFEEVALLRQDYISNRYHNLISGYMQPGETAEVAAAREIKEEIGLDVRDARFAGTYWFAKKEMLMIGFIFRAEKRDFTLSREVDQAQWTPAAQALHMVHPEGSVSYALVRRYLDEKQ